MNRSAFFHEDDYCQTEVLPIANFPYVQAEFRMLETEGLRNTGESPAGWNHIVSRPSSPTPLSSLNIAETDISSLVTRHLPPFEVVESGTFSYAHKCIKTRGFGEVTNVALFYDYNDNSIVEHIWFLFNLDRRDQTIEMGLVLKELGAKYPLILVDWSAGIVIPLANSVLVGAYLERRFDAFLERRSRRQALPNRKE